ncbi:hypothetical protein JL107_12070 [Nakamurella flavida]|uniref:Uncharacterized protein n=1 Tax=Nakamurella flavida TaxID=363630 RepID=A0A938YGD0_9ACTN|nr:hypothetical protein [Nakamurella flavida]MBM9477186.1 hypothetical protein [Nakamurella flavida]MDP9780135.1 hypothetical protein [Nakamurella flavida]
MTDRVTDAVAELYAGPLADFTPRRTALAKDARSAKDRDAATLIGALRKPTRAAFTVNQLARAHPERIAELLELGTDLREAEHSLDGPAMRELSGRRRTLVEDLAAVAFDLVDESEPATALQEDVVATLNAAVADEEIGGAVSAGALVKPVHWEGFGSVALADLVAVPDAVGAPPVRGPDRAAAPPVGSPVGSDDEPDTRTSTGRRTGRGQDAQGGDDGADRRAATRQAERDRAARAAEREAAVAERRHRQQAELQEARDAEQQAQDAVTAAHQAVQDRTDEVRAVQEQLAAARNRLDDARFAVRRAEIDQQKSAQLLDRLTRRAR